MPTRLRFGALVCGSIALAASAGCSKPTPADQQALLTVKSYIQTNLDQLHQAAVDLQAAAPAADADGWSASADAQSVADMKAAWKRARSAYEHVEGAIAVLFPELDVSTDQRYDGFLAIAPDSYLFDDQGVTGVHAIERILWSDSIPARVVTFESGLPGYVAAAFPKNEMEASDFKTKLCARLITDIETMRSQFAPLGLDAPTAYRGVIGSMNEQIEKADKAATGEEESRYAQYTLADMRANVEAGVVTYDAFRPWLLEKTGGAALDQQIAAGFKKVQDQYAAYSGDALPMVPSTWSSTAPSADDLQTPFGQLYTLLKQEADPDVSGSLVNVMNASADLLDIQHL